MDPQSATDYDDRGATAVVAVLLEIGQVLGAFRDRFVIIGGSVPWLLYPDAEPQHVGTLDVDLSLDAEALSDDDYTGLIEALERAGYERSSDDLRWFQLRRTIRVDDGEPVPFHYQEGRDIGYAKVDTVGTPIGHQPFDAMLDELAHGYGRTVSPLHGEVGDERRLVSGQLDFSGH